MRVMTANITAKKHLLFSTHDDVVVVADMFNVVLVKDIEVVSTPGGSVVPGPLSESKLYTSADISSKYFSNF